MNKLLYTWINCSIFEYKTDLIFRDMKTWLILQSSISYLTIVAGAALFINSADKETARYVLLAGLVGSVLSTITIVLYFRSHPEGKN